MTDVEILDEMLKPGARVELDPNSDKFRVKLTEPQAPESSVDIYNLPDDAIVIKVDKFSSADAVFNSSRGECRRADYVIISEDEKVIIYIEMKLTKDSETAIIQQLKSAQCFIVYCREIGKSFWMKLNFLDGYRHRFVSFGHTGNIPKRETREYPSGIHDKPDKMLKIRCPHYILFNMLTGKK